MRRALAILAAGLLLAPAAAAQSLSGSDGGMAIKSGSSVAALVAEGYEIKAAVPNGAKYVLFLQKDKKAFACEFVTVTQSRCGEIR